MRKSSRSVSLALIGSAFLLGGCQPAAEEGEWGDEQPVRADNAPAANEWGEDGIAATATEQGLATGNDQYHHSNGGRTASRIGGAIIGSQIGRAIGGGGAPTPGYAGRPGGPTGSSGFGGGVASPSARGGFGSSAGHSSAS